MFYQVSKNNTRTCWVLKCDIRKFFASIDSFGSDCFVGRQTNAQHEDRPPRKDSSALSLRAEANQELFMAVAKQSHKKGLPLGNLTSQLFVNIYMNEFDQFVKHKLSAKGGSASGGKAK